MVFYLYRGKRDSRRRKQHEMKKVKQMVVYCTIYKQAHRLIPERTVILYLRYSRPWISKKG